MISLIDCEKKSPTFSCVSMEKCKFVMPIQTELGNMIAVTELAAVERHLESLGALWLFGTSCTEAFAFTGTWSNDRTQRDS